LKEEKLEGILLSLGHKVKVLNQQRLLSKRNQVYLVEVIGDGWPELLIMKYGEASLIEQEAGLLKILKKKGITVPKVYLQVENLFFLEYIQGNNCCDFINSGQKEEEIDLLLREMAYWLVDFHSLDQSGKHLLKGDCNLRNFLWDGEKVYGIDFEEVVYGCPWTDVGEICSFILNTKPAFTPGKFFLANKFLEYYKLFSGQAYPSDFKSYINLSLLKAAKRRPGETKILQRMAEKIMEGNYITLDK